MTLATKAIIFVVVSAGIAWVSRRSLLNVRSHGFYRFFAWEAILALVLVNLDHWFDAPSSLRQIVSWLLLIASLFLVIHGARLLHVMGRPVDDRDDPSLVGLEKTSELVTVGAFRYIRHPLYSSLLSLTWGAFFKGASWATVGLAVLATAFLAITAKKEEAENIAYFGAAYQNYMRQTKMFIPFLF